MADLQQDLIINPVQIDSEIVKQPGLFAYYAQKLAESEGALKRQKLERDVFESSLDRVIRNQAVTEMKKLTEKQIDHAIRRNDSWVTQERKVIEFSTAVDQYKAIVESLRQKKDMLITYSANMRQEMTANGGFLRGPANHDLSRP